MGQRLLQGYNLNIELFGDAGTQTQGLTPFVPFEASTYKRTHGSAVVGTVPVRGAILKSGVEAQTL